MAHHHLYISIAAKAPFPSHLYNMLYIRVAEIDFSERSILLTELGNDRQDAPCFIGDLLEPHDLPVWIQTVDYRDFGALLELSPKPSWHLIFKSMRA